MKEKAGGYGLSQEGIMDVRFTADCNLGKLSKWLRILGYDTLYDRGNADETFLRKAGDAGRIALTRRRDLARRPESGCIVVVSADHVDMQIGEVLEALSLEPDPAKRMTRCLRCNAPLEEVSKESVTGLVPAYVCGICTQFRICRLCGRIFWPGTHPRHIEEYLRMHSPPRYT
jgi:uncharacterized protein with PIN domain